MHNQELDDQGLKQSDCNLDDDCHWTMGCLKYKDALLEWLLIFSWDLFGQVESSMNDTNSNCWNACGECEVSCYCFAQKSESEITDKSITPSLWWWMWKWRALDLTNDGCVISRMQPRAEDKWWHGNRQCQEHNFNKLHCCNCTSLFH